MKNEIEFPANNTNFSPAELAKYIDHSLLHPTMTDRELEEGCLIAKKYTI